MRGRENKKFKMDLQIIQKVSELSSEGRSTDDIKQELKAGGVAPETIEQALKEAGVSVGTTTEQPASAAPTTMHHEKIIQPSPGFDPNAK
jgi:hypothetical protein